MHSICKNSSTKQIFVFSETELIVAGGINPSGQNLVEKYNIQTGRTLHFSLFVEFDWDKVWLYKGHNNRNTAGKYSYTGDGGRCDSPRSTA